MLFFYIKLISTYIMCALIYRDQVCKNSPDQLMTRKKTFSLIFYCASKRQTIYIWCPERPLNSIQIFRAGNGSKTQSPARCPSNFHTPRTHRRPLAAPTPHYEDSTSLCRGRRSAESAPRWRRRGRVERDRRRGRVQWRGCHAGIAETFRTCISHAEMYMLLCYISSHSSNMAEREYIVYKLELKRSSIVPIVLSLHSFHDFIKVLYFALIVVLGSATCAMHC